ncbi:CoA transferase [Rhizobium sp. RU36D]|uniref:CoA transferase n=1 Tax=Rhizobium sp. RU36D TaxID=1907415 RepID=UPI0009D85430|nr:CoA transferase [Rhizobium sp. RU36D]SMC46895.1 CoA-transferase family III [Rhizobium sp. RU36D]
MPSPDKDPTSVQTDMLTAIWTAVGGESRLLSQATETGQGDLPSTFAVSDLASASMAAAGLAIAELLGATSATRPEVRVDRRLASLWFGTSLKPDGWAVPPAWDPIAGDYRGRDGWIRLHTNAPHHRRAALAVLGTDADKAAVTSAVSRFAIDELEAAVVAQGGCAAAMRDMDHWRQHPQGMGVAAEPLVHRQEGQTSITNTFAGTAKRPLAGVRVLDLTRVLAGPVATRFLASAGADVLRIDPLDWDEPGVLPDVTLGKRRARLDLKSEDGRALLMRLLADADILVHGYRADALERLGLDADNRQRLRPGLIDVSLNAYGWTGPWRSRRGFDSLVQMSTGIAEAGMRHYGTSAPKPLPVQALDHATGYILAAAAIRGLTTRLATNKGSIWRTSLARVAHLLMDHPAGPQGQGISGSADTDFSESREMTGWGPAWRLKTALTIPAVDLTWSRPAGPLGSDAPSWSA